MLLRGLSWDDLGWLERIDVAEAVVAEGIPLDQILDDFYERIATAVAMATGDAELMGQTATAQRGLAAAEALFGGPAEPKQKPPTVAADEPAE